MVKELNGCAIIDQNLAMHEYLRGKPWTFACDRFTRLLWLGAERCWFVMLFKHAEIWKSITSVILVIFIMKLWNMQTSLMHPCNSVKRRRSFIGWADGSDLFFLLVGLVAPVRNQKALGSCWAVSTAEAVEGLQCFSNVWYAVSWKKIRSLLSWGLFDDLPRQGRSRRQQENWFRCLLSSLLSAMCLDLSVGWCFPSILWSNSFQTQASSDSSCAGGKGCPGLSGGSNRCVEKRCGGGLSRQGADCGMFGGWPYLAYQFLQKAGGMFSEADWPYYKEGMFPCMPKGQGCFKRQVKTLLPLTWEDQPR